MYALAECNKYIFIFFAGDLQFFFSWCFREKKGAASAMYLNKHDCCVCTRLQGVLLTGENEVIYLRQAGCFT